MRLTENDVEQLGRRAVEDRESRIVGVALIPAAVLLTVFVCGVGPAEEWRVGVVLPVAAALLLFVAVCVIHGLRRLVCGAGSPTRVLAGRDPTADVTAVVRHGDGDEPFPISVALRDPIGARTRYLHLSGDRALRVGDRVRVVGFGPPRRPFRGMALLVTASGERVWTRDRLSREARYREPKDG